MARTQKIQSPGVIAQTADPTPRYGPSGEVDGEIEAIDASHRRAAVSMPHIAPSSKFFLAVRPDLATIDEDYEVIHDVRTIAVMGGIWGMQTDATGEVKPRSLQRMFEKWTAKKFQVLPHNFGPGGSYVRVHKVPGGKARLPFWAQAYAGQDVITIDAAKRREWLADLVATGKIDPVLPVAVKGLMRGFVAQGADAQKDAEKEHYRRCVDACERWLAAHDKPITTEPVEGEVEED